MRIFITSMTAFTLFLASCQTLPGKNTETLDSKALHARTLTLDTHVDIPLTYMTEIDPGTQTQLQVDLNKLQKGGLDAAFFIVYTPQTALTADNYVKAAQIAQTRMSAIQALTKKYYDRTELALTSSDVNRIVDSEKTAVLVGMENAFPLGNTVDQVDEWAERGVRYMGITHFGHNQFGDSSNPHPDRDAGPRHNGLSALGRDLVRAMNDNGIMIDVSHAGKETMMQAADLSRSPIIASHSGVMAIAESARNLDDEQLRKIRDVGGVAQMVALDAYVKPYSDAQIEFRDNLRAEFGVDRSKPNGGLDAAAEALFEERLKGMWDIEPRASVADFVDHIDHAVKIAGIDHVGIASDFDGGGGIDGWEDASETASVTAELVARGYSENDISKIWSGNLLRVLSAAQAIKSN